MDMIEKLDKWVREHPEEADAPTINVTTGEEFTIRGLLEKFKKEKDLPEAALDAKTRKLKEHVKKWMEGM